MRNRLHVMVWLSCLGIAACGDGNEPQVQPCSAQNSVMVGSLALGEWTSFAPTGDGCAMFSANATADTIEYVVIAHSVSSNPNRQADFRLSGDGSIVGPSASISASLQAAAPSPA